jgi:selenide, water dikinase
VLFDPQTSGGLLIAVEDGKKDVLLKTLHQKGVRSARLIGRVVEDPGSQIRVVK